MSIQNGHIVIRIQLKLVLVALLVLVGFMFAQKAFADSLWKKGDRLQCKAFPGCPAYDENGEVTHVRALWWLMTVKVDQDQYDDSLFVRAHHDAKRGDWKPSWYIGEQFQYIGGEEEE